MPKVYSSPPPPNPLPGPNTPRRGAPGGRGNIREKFLANAIVFGAPQDVARAGADRFIHEPRELYDKVWKYKDKINRSQKPGVICTGWKAWAPKSLGAGSPRPYSLQAQDFSEGAQAELGPRLAFPSATWERGGGLSRTTGKAWASRGNSGKGGMACAFPPNSFASIQARRLRHPGFCSPAHYSGQTCKAWSRATGSNSGSARISSAVGSRLSRINSERAASCRSWARPATARTWLSLA
jgi:hypothetical protein